MAFVHSQTLWRTATILPIAYLSFWSVKSLIDMGQRSHKFTFHIMTLLWHGNTLLLLPLCSGNRSPWPRIDCIGYTSKIMSGDKGVHGDRGAWGISVLFGLSIIRSAWKTINANLLLSHDQEITSIIWKSICHLITYPFLQTLNADIMRTNIHMTYIRHCVPTQQGARKSGDGDD